VYPDPYYGMNLRSIAGISYAMSTNFSSVPMPPDCPFRPAWCHRTEFKLSADYMGLWRDVWISATGPVAVRFPSVATSLNLPATDLAQLTVRA
jgi:hypothetical protein